MDRLRRFAATIHKFYLQLKTADNNPQSTTRWGLLQLHIAFAFFFFGIDLAGIPIYFEFSKSRQMPDIGLIIFIIMLVMTCIAGLFFIYRAIALASIWLSKDSEDTTATKQDLEKLEKKLIMIDKKLNKLAKTKSTKL